MFTDVVPSLVVAVPLACLLVAAWPLLASRRLRPALLGLGGSGCVGIGATIVGLLAGGLVSLPTLGPRVLAEDKPPEAAPPAEKADSPLATIKADASINAEASDPIIEGPHEMIEIPPGRPEWVNAEPKLTGKTHTIPVASGPYALDPQSRKALDEAIAKAANNYIAQHLGSDIAPQLLFYNTRSLKKRFVKPENTYHDVARYSVGWMHENFALLEFPPEFRQELDKRWTQVRAGQRLAQTGLLAGAGLLLVGSIFGYFRLDNATRGYYTGRLQFMTGAAILAIVGAGAAVAQWIHWL